MAKTKWLQFTDTTTGKQRLLLAKLVKTVTPRGDNARILLKDQTVYDSCESFADIAARLSGNGLYLIATPQEEAKPLPGSVPITFIGESVVPRFGKGYYVVTRTHKTNHSRSHIVLDWRGNGWFDTDGSEHVFSNVRDTGPSYSPRSCFGFVQWQSIAGTVYPEMSE